MPSQMGRVVFITGTDTGAGKTVLTSLCLSMLLEAGERAVAIKPFCSGPRDDAEILFRLQEGRLPIEWINPFCAEKSVAPMLGFQRERRRISIDRVNRHIDALSRKYDWLLVEGAGGLLSPLGDAYSLADLIATRACRVVVAVRNRLGAINHSRLAINSLSQKSREETVLVLMGDSVDDLACQTNEALLSRILARIGVVALPYFGEHAARSARKLRGLAKKSKKTLARVVGAANLLAALAKEKRRSF